MTAWINPFRPRPGLTYVARPLSDCGETHGRLVGTDVYHKFAITEMTPHAPERTLTWRMNHRYFVYRIEHMPGQEFHADDFQDIATDLCLPASEEMCPLCEGGESP